MKTNNSERMRQNRHGREEAKRFQWATKEQKKQQREREREREGHPRLGRLYPKIELFRSIYLGCTLGWHFRSLFRRGNAELVFPFSSLDLHRWHFCANTTTGRAPTISRANQF